MRQILTVTTPFFALVLLGWAVVRGRRLSLQAIPGLNSFVLFFALPCMLFRFSASTPITQLLDASVVTVYLAGTVAVVALAAGVARRQALGWSDAAFGALVAAFPNSGFMGVPLLIALFGQAAAAPAIVALALDMVVTSSLCIALSQLGAAAPAGRPATGHPVGAAVSRALRGILTNPLPWAIGLGTLSSAAGLLPPAPLMRAVDMLAGAASPVALFALGAMFARGQMAAPLPRSEPHNASRDAARDASSNAARSAARSVLTTVAFKLLLHPLLVLAAGHIAIAAGLPLDPFAAAVLVLVAALPSASNVPMLAERFGADAGRLARVVLVSTVCAFGSFTLAVAWIDAKAPVAPGAGPPAR